MKKLPVLCPQLYDGLTMRVVACTRCCNWEGERCGVATGAEHFSPASIAPVCPIQALCQHQIQSGDVPCTVRRAGLICESALTFSGVANVEMHPLGFNAYVCASPEELEETP